MIKVKLKRFIAMMMAAMMTLSSNAFATEINLENSNANVNKHGTVTKNSGSDTFDDETTNVWQDGKIDEEVRVNVDVASSFTITIPKEIVLNGNDGSATYKVKCEGDIAGDQTVLVVPISDEVDERIFTLYEDGGKQVDVTVTQPDTDFTYVELNDAKEHEGSLSAQNISAGNWSGSFYFNIGFIAERCAHKFLPKITKFATETEKGEITYTCEWCGKSYKEEADPSFSTMSWDIISDIADSGRASEVFNTGDEKELVIDEFGFDYNSGGHKYSASHIKSTYHIQILGFNHDDLADGTGKASITFGIKETMNYNKPIPAQYNFSSKIYDAMPDQLKSKIKTVTKKFHLYEHNGFTGYENDTIKSYDTNLFMLSESNVFGNSIDGEEQYDYYKNGGSKIKYQYGTTNPVKWHLMSIPNDYPNGRIYSGVDKNGKYIDIDWESISSFVYAFCI